MSAISPRPERCALAQEVGRSQRLPPKSGSSNGGSALAWYEAAQRLRGVLGLCISVLLLSRKGLEKGGRSGAFK